MRGRGFTLIELLIYTFLSMLILAAVFALYNSGRRNYHAVSSSFMIGQEAEVGLRWVRADLQEAALNSVRIYPRPGNTTEPPGVSFMSARSPKDSSLQISDAGAPAWQKHVFYTLVRDGQGPTGSLVRWEKAVSPPPAVPSATTLLPSSLADGSRQRVILRGLAWPYARLEGRGNLGEMGGFQLRFVRKTAAGEVLVADSPADATAAAAANPLTENMQILGQQLPLLDMQITLTSGNSETGATSYIQLPFRVSPRY